MPKIYSEEFRATALELLDSGMTQQQVCDDLGSSKSTLRL
ncbi:helix-turn-helix domain-containing protein [Nesterenkonia sp. F]